MKRFAFLFGNTMGLQGVKRDVESVAEFLKSGKGGAWNDSEIKVGYNLSLNDVRSTITDIRLKAFDYVFIYYSGHGCSARGTKLYLNNANECLKEEELFNMSKKQLMIYDCCRVSTNQTTTKVANVFCEFVSMTTDFRDRCRRRYENLIAKASEQQVCLYACKDGKCAYDTVKGGVYTQQLIDKVIETCQYRDAYINVVHEKTAAAVRHYSSLKGILQDPEMNIYCLDFDYKPLVIGLQDEVDLKL